MVSSLLLASILFFIIIIHTTAQNISIDQHLGQASLKIARLELIIEEKNRDINAVNSYVEQKEKAIEVTTSTIEVATSAINRLSLTIKEDLSDEAQERLSVLENEVRRLWEVSRRNNFEIHNLESKARDAHDRWEATISRFEKMVAIVSEQWIQIQHLEQAVQMAKLRTLKAKTELMILTKCPFLKYVSNAFSHHVEVLKENLIPYLPAKKSQSSFISQAYDHLSRFFTVTKYYHHQVQGLVKQALENHEFTETLANEEVVFFLASTLILFPMMIASMLLWGPRN